MKKQTITFATGAPETVVRNRKDAHFHRELAALLPDGSTPVILRTYCTGRKAYACVWIFGKNVALAFLSGGGSAGGYGYCRESAACGAALRAAGVTGFDPVDGRGMGEVRRAVEAIAKAATGKRRLIIHEAHA